MEGLQTEARPGPGFLTSELANGVTHGVGFALSIVGLIVLVVLAASRGSALHVVACSVYGATLILLYLASTLYHSVSEPRAKDVLRVVDHIAIYLLIAGTYTPFTLITLQGARGWTMFGMIWGLALLGSLSKLVFFGRFPKLSVVFYLLMGWMAVFSLDALVSSLSVGGLMWLFGGGLAYTVGVVFYAWKALPLNHAIWHLFVMLGSACHFFAIMFHVLPRAA